MLFLHNFLRRMWEDVPRSWGMKGLSGLFFILSLPYGLAVRMRNIFYDLGLLRQEKLPCPVISVGNITVGGTGKTPAVIMLARILKEEGARPLVLAHGYGALERGDVVIVSDGSSVLAGYEEAGDEALLLARSLTGVPVIAGRDRLAAGRTALGRFDADVLVVDDGFQHRRLHRDADILLLDGAAPFGNGRLLPSGALREPVCAVRRADAAILSGQSAQDGDIPPQLRSLMKKGGGIFRACHRPTLLIDGGTGKGSPPESLRGKRVYAFTGIGKPASFLDTIVSLGACVTEFLPYPDHHLFTADDVRKIGERAQACLSEVIATTEKDAARLGNFPDFLKKISILRIEMNLVSGEEALRGLLREKIGPTGFENGGR